MYGVLGGGVEVPGVVKNEPVRVVVVLVVVLVETEGCPGVAELLPLALNTGTCCFEDLLGLKSCDTLKHAKSCT